jgi:hypothetical protein
LLLRPLWPLLLRLHLPTTAAAANAFSAATGAHPAADVCAAPRLLRVTGDHARLVQRVGAAAVKGILHGRIIHDVSIVVILIAVDVTVGRTRHPPRVIFVKDQLLRRRPSSRRRADSGGGSGGIL